MFAGHSSGFVHVPVGVHQHFRPAPQVFQIRLADHLPQNVRHAADAQLNAVAVFQVAQHIFGDFPVRVGRRNFGQFGQRRVFAFHDIGDFGDMDSLHVSAVAIGDIFVHFQNAGLGRGGLKIAAGIVQAPVEEAVFIHRRHLAEENIAQVRAQL